MARWQRVLIVAAGSLLLMVLPALAKTQPATLGQAYPDEPPSKARTQGTQACVMPEVEECGRVEMAVCVMDHAPITHVWCVRESDV